MLLLLLYQSLLLGGMAMDALDGVVDHVVAPLAEPAQVVLARPCADEVLDVPHGLAVDIGTDVSDVHVRMQRVERGRDPAVPGMSDTGMISKQYPHGKDIATPA